MFQLSFTLQIWIIMILCTQLQGQFQDYKGQKLAEQIFQGIILLFAVVGFIWGYVCEQFVQTIYILGAGFILSCILTLPPWPIYRSNPVVWQKPKVEPDPDSKETQQPTKEKKTSKRKEKSK